VKTSPRLVEEGQPVPKGGGRQMVGKPYTVAGRTYVPHENPNYTREGTASWYGPSFHGRMTANGEVFDKFSVSAAHTTMPLPSYARVTNLSNNRSIIVRVNDRGPYHGNRVIDVSQRVAESLEFKHIGTAKVRVEYVGRASTTGSDDKILMASLTTDGSPARMPGGSSMPIMVASAPLKRIDVLPSTQSAPTQSSPIQSSSAQIAEGDNQDDVTTAATEPVAVALKNTSDQNTVLLAFAPLPPERPFSNLEKSSQSQPLQTENASVSDDEETPIVPMPPVRPMAAVTAKAKDGSLL
jgi:rare lipoprotein A